MLSGLRGEGRAIDWARGRKSAGEADFTHFFLGNAKLFSGEWGYIRRPTHDRLPALRQGSRTFPERGTWEAGRPGPPLLFVSAHLFLPTSSFWTTVETVHRYCPRS